MNQKDKTRLQHVISRLSEDERLEIQKGFDLQGASETLIYLRALRNANIAEYVMCFE